MAHQASRAFLATELARALCRADGRRHASRPAHQERRAEVPRYPADGGLHFGFVGPDRGPPAAALGARPHARQFRLSGGRYPRDLQPLWLSRREPALPAAVGGGGVGRSSAPIQSLNLLMVVFMPVRQGMFIRFLLLEMDLDPELGKPVGLFHGVHDLLELKHLERVHREQLEDLLKWFVTNLPEPASFAKTVPRSRRPHTGICWYKSSAKEHVRRMYEAKAILEFYDRMVDVTSYG